MKQSKQQQAAKELVKWLHSKEQYAKWFELEGGYATGEGDISRLMVGKNGRTQFNLHAEGNSALGENQREIALQATLTVQAKTAHRYRLQEQQ